MYTEAALENKRDRQIGDVKKPIFARGSTCHLKLSAQRNETETKLFQNCFEAVFSV